LGKLTILSQECCRGKGEDVTQGIQKLWQVVRIYCSRNHHIES
jgi:hypothetical protein